MTDRDRERVLNAMRSGEWLRTQWIARVAFDLGTSPWLPEHAARIRRVLKRLEREQQVERREATEHRIDELAGQHIEFDIPRNEWRVRR